MAKSRIKLPKEPKPPEEFVKVRKELLRGIEGFALSELIEKVIEKSGNSDLNLDNVYFDADHYDYYSKESVVCLESLEPNPKYKQEYEKYQKSLEKYNQKLKELGLVSVGEGI